AAEILSP
ncbi:ATP-dependent RNA helicase HrpB, partial [Haemophilus influenzae]